MRSALARDLARLLDALETEEIAAANLVNLVRGRITPDTGTSRTGSSASSSENLAAPFLQDRV
ncbi:MAG: hypothetical protein H6882_04520 [Rhodobiaceae bacterium]|nr:hypothetical protein [Rhodobiaceae bacterium]